MYQCSLLGFLDAISPGSSFMRTWTPELGLPDVSDGKESAHGVGDLGLIPVLGKPPGEGNDYILAWRIPWTEESMGSQGAGHGWSNLAYTHKFLSQLFLSVTAQTGPTSITCLLSLAAIAQHHKDTQQYEGTRVHLNYNLPRIFTFSFIGNKLSLRYFILFVLSQLGSKMQRLEPRLVAPASKVFVLNRFNLLTSASVSRTDKCKMVYAGITKARGTHMYPWVWLPQGQRWGSSIWEGWREVLLLMTVWN